MAQLTTTGLKISSGGRSYWSIVSGGITTNLDDLGFLVLSYIGAGMPPIKNVTQPYGTAGYELYQQTIVQPRLLTLIGDIEGDSLLEITQKRQALINFFKMLDRQAPLIQLRFQLIDRFGAALGTALFMPCRYVGGLEGNTDNVWGENVPLQFVEHAPPGIVEAATNAVTLTAPTLVSDTGRVYTRNPSTGAWTDVEGPFGSPITALAYDSANFLWTGLSGGAHRIGDSYAVKHVTSGRVYAIHPGIDGYLYVGGAYAQAERYNPTTLTWSNVGAASFSGGTSGVKDILYGGNLGWFATGDYTSPTGFFHYANPVGSSWTGISLGSSGYGATLALGQDLNIYVGGSFTNLGCNNIAKIVNYTLVPMGTGTNGPVNKIIVLPDGRILAIGPFTQAGGVTVGTGTLGINAIGIAVWDGYRWDAWPGTFTGATLSVLTQNPLNGQLMADGVNPLFNGVDWVPGNGYFNGVGGLSGATFAADGSLAIATQSAGVALSTGQVVTNNGSAEVFPQIKIVGNPGLQNITNYTTGKSIQFNGRGQVIGTTSTLQAGGPAGVSFQNTVSNNVMAGLCKGGDLANFNLKPGANNVIAYYTTQDANNYVQLVWQNTHWSFDSGTIGV